MVNLVVDPGSWLGGLSCGDPEGRVDPETRQEMPGCCWVRSDLAGREGWVKMQLHLGSFDHPGSVFWVRISVMV